MTHPPYDPDGNFRADMALRFGRRGLIWMGIVTAAGGYALWRGQGPVAAQTATGADGQTCTVPAAETAGPFPGDGTNSRAGQTVNVLTESGVLRQDIRPSFAGLQGTAEGAEMTVEIRLVNVNAACAPLAGHAVYLWHCDATGGYSLYTLPEVNYLRGMMVSDADGLIRFTTIFPGCYDGRWPHMHFEVFAAPEAAVSGDDAILTSQFALPEEACAALYASDSRYGPSAGNLTRTSLARDGIFRDNDVAELAAMTLAVTGDATRGYTATVTVGLAV